MAGENYREAALRHMKDAEALAKGKRWGGAGHLVGFAAECALKHRITSLRTENETLKRHFPGLIEIAKKTFGRTAKIEPAHFA